MNRSLKCYECRQAEKREKRRATGRKRLEDANAAGKVRLHSCLSSIHDAVPASCMCRKFVTFADAKRFVEQLGRCVDFQTRAPIFFQREIVETSRLKSPPVSSVGQRIAIERKFDLDEKQIAETKAIAEEDRTLRAQEQTLKIDIENEIALEERAKITRCYSDEEWLAIEKVQKTLPAYVSGLGHDERTSSEKKRKFRTRKITNRTEATAIRTESATAAEQGVELVSFESMSEAA